MATSRRRKGPARWLMAVLSGLAAAGFLGAILSGPHPTDATPAAANQAPAARAGDGGAGVVPALSQPSGAQPPVVTAPPRFRTRGS
jgi:hypothetical protein